MESRSASRLLTVVHVQMEDEFAFPQLAAPRRPKKHSMINERLKRRLQKDCSSITMTMRIPEDVIDSLKQLGHK